MTDVSTTNGHVPPPETDKEVGTELDFYIQGDSLFEVPGVTTSGEGLVYELRTPNVQQLKEMLDRDGRAKSLEQCLVMPIAGATWKLEGDDQDIVDWVDNALRTATIDGGMETPMSDVIAQKAEALVFRTSFHEKVIKTSSEGKYVYSKIAWRPSETCQLLRDKRSGKLHGFAQWAPDPDDPQALYASKQIPIRTPYADVFIHGMRRDPVRGISDLTVTYHNYRNKEKLKYLWFTYLEVLSLPRQIALGSTPEEAKKTAEAIAGLKNAGVAGIPRSWVGSPDNIKTLEVGGGGANEFMDAISYLDSDSALSLLAGFSELPARAMGSGSSHGPLGSYALAESSQNFFIDMLDSYTAELDAQITNNLIADLVRWNFGTKALVPKFRLDLEEQAIQAAMNMMDLLLTSPVPTNVPFEFVKELVLVVAKQLGMDVDTIAKAINEQGKANKAQATTAQAAGNSDLQAALDVGTKVAQSAQGNGTAAQGLVEQQ
jgi:hypothetical protein